MQARKHIQVHTPTDMHTKVKGGECVPLPIVTKKRSALFLSRRMEFIANYECGMFLKLFKPLRQDTLTVANRTALLVGISPAP